MGGAYELIFSPAGTEVKKKANSSTALVFDRRLEKQKPSDLCDRVATNLRCKKR